MSNKVRTIGKTVRVEEVSRIINDKLYSFYSPKIEVNGRLVFISDKNTESGIVESKTKEGARRKGRESINRIEIKVRGDD